MLKYGCFIVSWLSLFSLGIWRHPQFFVFCKKNRIDTRQCWNKWNTSKRKLSAIWILTETRLTRIKDISNPLFSPTKIYSVFSHDRFCVHKPLPGDLRFFAHALWHDTCLWHRIVTWSEIWPLKVLELFGFFHGCVEGPCGRAPGSQRHQFFLGRFFAWRLENYLGISSMSNGVSNTCMGLFNDVECLRNIQQLLDLPAVRTCKKVTWHCPSPQILTAWFWYFHILLHI